ncbi:hypothetical protein QE152_g40754 [Popillia japonica]|uniref:Uncharacterized protein n=1 Tax=Popillia japonica TaxID=7064 RepID=A0AAW1HFB0_POPJA
MLGERGLAGYCGQGAGGAGEQTGGWQGPVQWGLGAEGGVVEAREAVQRKGKSEFEIVKMMIALERQNVWDKI